MGFQRDTIGQLNKSNVIHNKHLFFWLKKKPRNVKNKQHDTEESMHYQRKQRKNQEVPRDNENRITTYPNLWDTAAIPREESISIQACIKKQNNLKFPI